MKIKTITIHDNMTATVEFNCASGNVISENALHRNTIKKLHREVKRITGERLRKNKTKFTLDISGGKR